MNNGSLIHTLKGEYYRAFIGKRFWMCVVAVIFLCYLTSMDELTMALRFSDDVDVFYFITAKEGLGVFLMLISTVSIIPGGIFFLEDRQTQFWRYNIQREGVYRYGIGKIVVAFTGAFLAVCVGYFLFFGALNLKFAFLNENLWTEIDQIRDFRFGQTAMNNQCLKYYLMEFTAEAAGYGFMSVAALIVSTISKNTFIVLSSPIIFYYISMYINQLLRLPICFNWQYIMKHGVVYEKSANDAIAWLGNMGYFLFLILIAGGLYLFLLRRRIYDKE